MFIQEEKLYQERIEVFIKRLREHFYEDKSPLTTEYCKFDPMVSFEKRLEGNYIPIQAETTWGKNWERAWFHLKGCVPLTCEGKRVCARINLGSECLIFDKDGTPIQGLSIHTLWPIGGFIRDRYEIFKSAKGGEEVDLWIEASATQLFGLELKNDEGELAPITYGHYEAKVQTIELTVFRKDIWDLCLDFLVLNDQMRALPNKSVRRARLLQTLNRVIDDFQFNGEGVQNAREALKVEMNKNSCASDLETLAVGHAHLDTAWLWPICETIRKCARTFSNQIGLIEKYPKYVFGASQAQHYKFVKDHYPTLYAKIKAKIAEGRWEVQGGMWVEADCNLISGESMVRQILHGKNFFKDEFQVEVKNLWLPDVFGYSGAMPQILKKTGIHYFITQKLSWNQFNRFPHHTFIWRGIDGSEIITHFPPEENYSSELKPSGLMRAQEDFKEKAFLDEFLTLFGHGDGGGGPTEEMIEAGLRQQDLENSPRVIFGKALECLNRMKTKKEELAVWVGELYFELHRGTYTTHAYNKKMNRYMELMLREIEILYSSLPHTSYPVIELDRMWKCVLMNQFHDIIPGSSITPVYEDSHKDYEKLFQQAMKLINEFAELGLEKGKNSLCLINTLSHTYKRPIELPESWLEYEIFDENNEVVTVQTEEKIPVVSVVIPPLTAFTLRRGKKKKSVSPGKPPRKIVLENDLILYEFTESGTISKAFDKECQRDILVDGGLGNNLRMFEDRPVNWDAWDIDIFYENQFLEQAQLASYEWITLGPVRQVVRLNFKIGNSTISQKIYLASNSKRLDFVTGVNWQECHKLLRVYFEVDLCTDAASYEIQYGHIKRNTHRNTSWDMAKFEVIGHRYTDYSERNYGIALLNDCKYGYQIHDHVISLSLLRAPTVPDPRADRGHHRFTYSFLPHKNDLIGSEVLSEAAQLNQKVLCYQAYRGDKFQFPYILDSEEIVLEVAKKAEKEDATILRVYEPMGMHATSRLLIKEKNVKIYETDMLEINAKELNATGEKVLLKFHPFEIKTLKIVKK